MERGDSKKWYIYGLSANPPTNAHFEIINSIDSLNVPLTVVPSFRHPIKTNLISFEHRVNMLHVLCARMKNVCVSRIEEEFPVATTYDLIVRLRSRVQLQNTTTFVIVCDMDIMQQILNLSREKALDLLASNDVEFCVVLNRTNDTEEAERSVLEHCNLGNRSISFLRITCDDTVRSTTARETNGALQTLIRPCVYEYIQENGIVFV